jgi:hypothetical protein
MSIESFDDAIWENYDSLDELHISLPYTVNLRISVSTIMSLTLVNKLKGQIEQRWEDHKFKHAKLLEFKNSLDPSLRDCVDPFLEQQDKLRRAYYRLWIGI